jgi:hypothetical protein
MAQGKAALQADELWNLLVETVHSLPMYKHHKRYVQEVMLKDQPDVSAKELAIQINVSLGEAMVLLAELRETGPSTRTDSAVENEKPASRTLLDFSD